MKEYAMKRLSSLLALGGMVALAVLGGRTLSAADKDTVQVPGGLAMSEFKGYEDWAVVATSETNELIKVMVANPTMIAAYKAGIPLNGKPFPASGSFTPEGSGSDRGHACHTIVKAKDYIFTAYGKR
jgi:hypothetical protein